MPDVVLPPNGEIWSVVQLYIDNKPLLISKPDNKLHGQILEDILNDRGIKQFDRFNAGTSDCTVP